MASRANIRRHSTPQHLSLSQDVTSSGISALYVAGLGQGPIYCGIAGTSCMSYKGISPDLPFAHAALFIELNSPPLGS
jgi:hypothetical protein